MMTVFFAIALMLVVCLSLIYHVTKPIAQTIQLAKSIRIGDRTLDLEFEEIYGLMDAKRVFSKLFERIEQLVKTVMEEQQAENQLRYEMLRAQINPHFLFNALNAIKWSAIMDGANDVGEMISKLGGLLEMNLARGDDLIPITKEMELIKMYSDIKNMTREHPFAIDFDIPAEFADYRILRFILQPLVENSVLHGLSQTKDGKITIKMSHVDAESVMVRVMDNGIGIGSSQLQTVRDKLGEMRVRPKGGTGLGLFSIHGIIRLQYGEPYGVSIDSGQSGGTVVSLLLPIAGDQYAQSSDRG
jgi:sensor histidine kinase YesM